MLYQSQISVQKPVPDMQPGSRLQRTCACGRSSSEGGECTECRAKGGHRAQSQEQKASRYFSGRGFAHNFADVRVDAPSGGAVAESRNSRGDEDPIHQPIIDDFRRRHGLPQGGVDKEGNRVGPSDAEIKYGGLALQCPSSVELESTINLNPEALANGYRTAYGILAKMRVLPDYRNWNGTQISEVVTPVPGTCPPNLTREPCASGPPFTVGAPTKSSPVHPVEPGIRNRFYDFHRTRWKSNSLLHDQTHNPQNLSTCESKCDQQYLCDGQVIGHFVMTNRYRKSTYQGKDVTIVDVTKK